jgi:hypothetical protein
MILTQPMPKKLKLKQEHAKKKQSQEITFDSQIVYGKVLFLLWN